MDSDLSEASPFSICSIPTSIRPNKTNRPSKVRFVTEGDNQHRKSLSSSKNKGKPKPLDFSASINDTTRTLKRHWHELQNNIKKAIVGNELEINLIESPYDKEYEIANEFVESPTKMTRAQLNLARNVVEILERLTINSRREELGAVTQSSLSRLNSIIEQFKLALSDSTTIDKLSSPTNSKLTNENVFINAKPQNTSDHKFRYLFQTTSNSPTYRDNFKKNQPRYTLLSQLAPLFLYRGGYHLIRTAITLSQVIKFFPVHKIICFLESKFLTIVLVICFLLRAIRSNQAKA